MADNKVLIEFQIVQKGNKISAVAKETDQLTKAQDKAAASQKKLTKQQDMGYGRQKQGLVQTANSTKNFSKLANTIDGGGGGTSLVGAYATLAANVFAASAAFNALSRAAEFQQLQQGLEIVGNQSGRTLSVLAEGLRDATDGALSLEQASRGAALGVSGGFGAKELTGLAEIAKGASIALGRDLGDAFDRLTRGAIKLEPEILDELGIMVRLDDAVEKYAAQLGKSAGSLSQLERRQAFMNEILEQGATKFGDIKDAVDPTPYQLLAATFSDLVRGIFTFVNETLGLNAIIGVLANSTTALFGSMLLFGSTIAGQILPGLANAGARAAEFATGAAELADNALEAAQAQEALAKANILSFKGGAKKFQLAQKELALDINNKKARKQALKSLEASERARARNLQKFSGKIRADKEIELQQVRRQIRLIKELEAAEAGQSAARIAAQQANIAANFAEEQANITQGVSSGELGLFAAIKASNVNLNEQQKELAKLGKAGKNTTGILASISAANGALALTFKKVVEGAKLAAAAFLRFLPIIGVVVAAVGIAILAFDKIYNTEKVKAYKKANEGLNTIIGKLNEKTEEYNKTLGNTNNFAQTQIRQFSIISNTISETNAQLEKTIELRKAAEAEGSETRGSTFLERFGLELAGRNPLEGMAREAGLELDNFAEGIKGDADLRRALVEIWDIQGSAEYKSFKALLESDIPAIAEDLAERVDFANILFNPDGTRRTIEEVQTILAKAINESQQKFGLLGSAVEGFNQQLVNAEKTSSQFVLKFFPKTSATEIVNQFKGIKQGLDLINDATKQAEMSEKDRIDTVSKALSEVGPNVRKLLGASIRDPILEIIKARGEIAKFGDESLLDPVEDADKIKKIEQLRAKIQTELNKLGADGEQTVKDTLETLVNIQKNEVLRKVRLEEIAQQQKVVSKATKLTAEATKLSLKFDREKMRLKQEELQTELLLLARTSGATDQEIARDGAVASLVKKRAELVAQGEKEEEILAIDLKLAQARNAATEQELFNVTEGFKIELAKQNVLKTQLADKEKILTAEMKIEELQRKQAAFALGRATAGQAATLSDQIANEEKRLKIVRDKAKIEAAIIKAQNQIIKAELKLLADKTDITTTEGLLRQEDLMNTIAGIDTTEKLSLEAIKKTAEATEEELKNTLQNAVQATFFDSPIASSIDSTMVNMAFGQSVEDEQKKTAFQLNMIRNTFEDFGKTMEDLFGEDGKVIASISRLAQVMAETALGIRQSFASIDEQFNNEDGFFFEFKGTEKGKTLEGLLKFGAVAQSVSGVISGFQQVLQSDAERRVAAVDEAIALEKKLDGKSAESLAKIAAMEKKKESMQRKAFERNKKLQIANAIISTASAAATTYAALAENPFLAMAMAAAITALGLAQVAIIKKTQFSGGNTEPGIPNKTSLEIGKRSTAVDVAKSATSGELSFLRGGNTTGQNLGGAGGGFPGASMGRKGYADGGVIVGERGPEVITPAVPVDVIPNFALGGQPANVNFTINAVDAAGVEDVLMNQRGNIIGMIREAANENGERFLETVDTQAYGGNK